MISDEESIPVLAPPGLLAQKGASPLGHHDRVDNQFANLVLSDFLRHGEDDRRRGEHSRLGRIHPDVARYGVELFLYEVDGDLVDPLDPQGVLGRERRDDSHAEAPQGRDRLEIGLDPCTPAGIGSRYGEHSLYFHLIFPDIKRHTPRDVPCPS